jgi:hypothetical protein
VMAVTADDRLHAQCTMLRGGADWQSGPRGMCWRNDNSAPCAQRTPRKATKVASYVQPAAPYVVCRMQCIVPALRHVPYPAVDSARPMSAIAGYPADDGQCRRLWFAAPCIRCVWESVRIRRSARGAGLRRLCRSERRWLWSRSACQWRPLLCAASLLGQWLLRNRRLGPGAMLRLVSPRAGGLSETDLLVAYLNSRRVGVLVLFITRLLLLPGGREGLTLYKIQVNIG